MADEQTPIERAADAMRDEYPDLASYEGDARAVFESIDVGELARTIHGTRDARHRETLMCGGGPTAPHSCWAAAEAVKAHLLGGAS